MSGGQHEGKMEKSENSLQTLCLPLDCLDLTHTDGRWLPLKHEKQMMIKGGNPATKTVVHRAVM